MAHFLRLIFAALLALFLLPAHALIPTVATYTGNIGTAASVPVSDLSLDSLTGVCQALVPPGAGITYLAAGAPTYSNNGTTASSYCGFWQNSQWKTTGYNVFIVKGSACPANSSPSGSSCACASSYSEDSTHTSCVGSDPCAALAGLSAGDWWKDMGVNAAGTGPKSRSFSVCDGYTTTGGGKCVATVANATCTNSDTDGQSGFWRCGGKAVYTGSSAVAGKCDLGSAGAGTGDTPANPSPATPPVAGTDPPKAPDKPLPGTAAPAPCPSGQAPGTVNGTSSCYPTGSDSPKAGGSDASTTNSDGSKVTQHDETTCNAGGSLCSTSTTKCTTAAGSSTATCATSSSTDTATGLCARTPGNSVCGGGDGGPGNSFGGTCAGGFKAVSEDAVLNAMAEETFRQNCKVNPSDGETTLAKTERVKTGNQTGDNPNNVSLSISPSSIDTSDAIGGGGGCIGDKVINVAGGTVVLPLSRSCDSFPMLGNLLVAIGFLVAAVIIMRG